ncbi:hypothetical protein KAW43_01455 [Candidatus Parcubacteria bacterium]|jgi:ribosomal protein L28|nr:hypothetical protein [Candidatus Parcubacteria bacterium]
MKQCPICQKKSIMARKLNKLRGKYNPSPKKRKYPNLQWVRVPMDVKPKFKEFAGKRILACTKCIKSLSKLK